MVQHNNWLHCGAVELCRSCNVKEGLIQGAALAYCEFWWYLQIQWCQIDSGATGTELLQRKLWWVLTRDEISVKTDKQLDQLISMLLCAMLGVGITGEFTRCLLLGLPLESDGMILKSSWRLELLLWSLVMEMIGAA